jgi:hypothetical protein
MHFGNGGADGHHHFAVKEYFAIGVPLWVYSVFHDDSSPGVGQQG